MDLFQPVAVSCSILEYRIQVKKLQLIIALLFGFLDLLSQNCTDSVYRFGYFSTDSIYAADHIVTDDNGSLIIGETRNYPSKKGLVFRLNSAGDIVWSRELQGNSRLDLYKALLLTDGGFIVAGTVLHPDIFSLNSFLAKIDANGNLMWQKLFSLNNNDNHNPVHIYNITEGISGDILVSWQRGGIDFGINDDQASSLLMRLDPNGELVWSKNFKTANTNSSNLAGIFLINGRIVVLGQAYDNTSTCPISGQGGLFTLMELDYNTGTIQQQKSYCFLEIPSNVSQFESPDNHYSAIRMENGNLALFGTLFQRTDSSYHYKILFDSNLNPYYSALFATPYNFNTSAMIRVLPSGEATITRLSNSTHQVFYGFIDRNDNITNQKVNQFSTDIIPIDFNYNFSYHYFDWSFRERQGTKISIVNNHTIGNRRYIEFTSMHKSGDTLTCLGTDASFIGRRPFNITPTTWSWNTVQDNRVVGTAAGFTITTYAIQREVQCILTSGCNELKIAGSDTVCLTANTVDYVAKKGNCLKEIIWEFDNAWVETYTRLNDSIIRIKFKQPVSAPVKIKLYASFTDCLTKDSLQITLLPGVKALPADTIICGAVNMKLSAGPWMKSYQWQDGSVDSIYTATDKGIYWVRVEDHCGNIFSDTIRIREPFIDLGNDMTLCSGDSITLAAPTGFSNYNWSPTGFVQLSDNMIRVSPVTPTVYLVSAGTSDGCIASDNIRIDLHPAVSGFIIPDTAVCSFGVLTLRPFDVFNSYLWNNGSTAAFITIDMPGNYWLEVTNQNGCKGKEDIVVRSKTCPSFVYFPSAFTPGNDGKNDLFKPVTSGPLLTYHFEIYNRWGQKMFSSTDPQKGWDGSINGKPQSTGVFVWTCQYQLQGDKKEYRKGTVTLIK